MTNITLTLPDEVYSRLHEAAAASALPLEEWLLHHLRTVAGAVLAPDEEAELYALQWLTDDTLLMIADEQMPPLVQERLHALMDKNTLGRLTAGEAEDLAALAERSDRLMVRRAEALAVLRKRSTNAG